MKQGRKIKTEGSNPLFQQAAACFERGDLAGAERLTRNLLSQSVDHPDANHLLGLIAIQSGQMDSAVPFIERAIKNNPRQITYYNSLALALQQSGHLEEALLACDRAIKIKPRSVDAHSNRGILLKELGRLDEALAACERAIKIDPQFTTAHNVRGAVLKDLGRLEEALVVYERVLRLAPRSAEAHMNSGAVLLTMRRAEEALIACNRAAELAPESAEACTNLGRVQIELNHFKEAMVSFEQAIRINPQCEEARFSLGALLSDSGRKQDALAVFEQAARISPQSYEALIKYSDILRSNERHKDAISVCEQAIRINPESYEAYLILGSVLLDTNQQDQATGHLQTALKFNPDLPNVKYILAVLSNDDAPEKSPQEYVELLFNDMAEQFDQHLVHGLEYSVPHQLFDAVSPHLGDSSRNLDILDLGCGTGLCAVAFAPRTNSIIGVDLAPQMLARSKERGLYTKLVQADICQALEQGSQKFDLVVSADVFIYIGKLDQVFTLVSQRLSQGGLFVFSVETEETEDYRLTDTGRYAQSSAYIKWLSEANCFVVVSCTSINIRLERGVPVPGKLFVLRLPVEP